ncbi:hypothetical protein QBC43DRAFT_309578 [Cladorrhinum sp. PSN259]|nr:hypothetical protein QBC43DRAFT_309578 [Cladorrhinum sp. PSN259]
MSKDDPLCLASVGRCWSKQECARCSIMSIRLKKASWRNGSAFDSRSKGYPFKSGRGHDLQKINFFVWLFNYS